MLDTLIPRTINLEDLATKMGITDETLRSYRENPGQMRLSYALIFCDAVGCHINDVVDIVNDARNAGG